MADEERKEERKDELSYSQKLLHLRQAMYSRALAPKIKTRPRHEMQLVDEKVPTDWTPDEEVVATSTVAPKAIALAQNAMWWVLGGAVLFFVASVSVFFYYFTIGGGGTVASPGNIEISVRGPSTIVGGEPAQFQVIVTNRNQADLELADLLIKYPPGTRSPTDFITNLTDQRIPLGTIEPGGQRQGTVSAILVGKEGVHEQIKVELEYRVVNSNAIFVSDNIYEFVFSNSPVTLSLEANSEAISGQHISLTARVSAGTDTILKDALLEFEYPFGFKVESRTPEPKSGNVWELGDLRPGEDHVINVRGVLQGQEGDERVFKARTGTRKEMKTRGIDVVLSESIHHVAIARPFIGLDLAINNDSGDEAVTVSPGQTVNVAIPWVNNLSVPITNAVIVAKLSGLGIQKSSVRTVDGFYRSTDNTLLWDKSTTKGALDTLEPGERGTVTFSFVMPQESDLVSAREATLDIAIHAAGKRSSETSVPETLQSSVSRTLKLASNVKIIAQGLYYTNPFGSVGPLPPKVDQETTYAVVLTVLNTSNKIKGGKVVAQLPPYVRWIGVHSPAQEHVTFNSTDGTIQWNVGDVAQGAGVKEVPPRNLAFALGFTPSASQVGQQPPLLRNIILTGTDTFTQAGINVVHNDVTTNLVDDQGFSALEANVVE